MSELISYEKQFTPKNLATLQFTLYKEANSPFFPCSFFSFLFF